MYVFHNVNILDYVHTKFSGIRNIKKKVLSKINVL